MTTPMYNYFILLNRFLDCEPCTINSLHLSAQQRKRFFWSNLVDIKNIDLDKDEKNVGPLLDEYLNKNLNRVANVDKIGTITTKKSCLQDGKLRLNLVIICKLNLLLLFF